MWAAPSHGLGSQDEYKEESELRVKHQHPHLYSLTVAARGDQLLHTAAATARAALLTRAPCVLDGILEL